MNGGQGEAILRHRFREVRQLPLHCPVRIAIRPPEYFPGQAYMALVAYVDCFVLADTFRRRRRSMQSRAKLRTPQGWQWISVPLRGKQRGRPLYEARIETRERWLAKHWHAFQYNYRSTPYFEFYEPDVTPFFQRTWEHLGALTCASVELLCTLMKLDTRVVRASTLEGCPDRPTAVWEAVGGGEMMTLAGKAHDAEEDAAWTRLRFDAPSYRQNFDGFEPGMSTVDLLFNRGPETLALLREGLREKGVDA